jgi:2-polyprenyl-3-methyl-5-hydroxy-6-metoxy-1,4-benzoquinol methylase
VECCILCGNKGIVPFDVRALLWRCPQCSLIFDNPRPTLRAITGYYSQKGKYGPWLEVEANLDVLRRKLLQRILGFKGSGDLLEIGAGIGHFISLARRHFSCTGTEISSEAVEIAKSRFGVDLLQGEAESLDFGGKEFDVVVLFHVLEHLPYPGRTLCHCKNLLKPDGILYIAVPNEALYSLRVLLPALLSLIGIKKYRSFSHKGFRRIGMGLEEIHLSHFSEPALRRFLKSEGFSMAGSGMDFIDPFTHRKGAIQIPRHALYYASRAIYALTGINTYNSLWIAAKKPE